MSNIIHLKQEMFRSHFVNSIWMVWLCYYLFVVLSRGPLPPWKPQKALAYLANISVIEEG